MVIYYWIRFDVANLYNPLEHFNVSERNIKMAIRLEFVCFALPNVGEIISFILKRLMYIYIIRTRLSVGLQIAQP